MVPKDWQHPKDDRGYIPLNHGPYLDAKEDWDKDIAHFMDSRGWSKEEAIEYVGTEPIQWEYMPYWEEEEATHFMMYENTSEGTPMSPACETQEELAQWLVDHHASTFGHDSTATYEQWLATIRAGFAHSVVSYRDVDGNVVSGSGVQMAEHLDKDREERGDGQPDH